MRLTFPCRDTVQSTGWVSKRSPFCGSNSAIAHFRHALALDERRVRFIPLFYAGGNCEHQEFDSRVHEFENHVNGLYVEDTDAEEVFFAGAHCGLS